MSKIVTDQALEAALRAASAAMADGPLLLYLLVVEEDENGARVCAASNFADPNTKMEILHTELARVCVDARFRG